MDVIAEREKKSELNLICRKEMKVQCNHMLKVKHIVYINRNGKK